MTWQQTIDEAKYIAREEGREECAIESAKNFLKKSNLSPEMIAECCSLPLEEVRKLADELKIES